MILSRLRRVACRPPGRYDPNLKGGDQMYVEFFHGDKLVTTVYNVIQVFSDNEHRLLVRNKQDGMVQFKTYEFKKDYDWFKAVSG